MRKRISAGAGIGMMLLLTALALPSWASKPAFSLDRSAWLATEIFVGQQRGDDVVVLETWRGHFAKGDVIDGLDLPAMPAEVFRRRPDGKFEPLHKTVSGRRVVLFLKRPNVSPRAKQGIPWVGADNCEPRIAAVWLEEDQAYAFGHFWSDDPVALIPLVDGVPLDEEKLKLATVTILAQRDALAKASGPAEVAKLLEQFGPVAKWCSETRQHEGPWVTSHLQDQLEFCRRVVPQIKPGEEQNSDLGRHRDIVEGALWSIQANHYLPARDLVREVRDFWASQPQLKDKRLKLEGITELCDEVLKSLERPADAQPTK